MQSLTQRYTEQGQSIQESHTSTTHHSSPGEFGSNPNNSLLCIYLNFFPCRPTCHLWSSPFQF